MRWLLESSFIADMIRKNHAFDDPRAKLGKVPEKTLNLRGLKCPLPALRTKKALSQAQPGDIYIVECTDPLARLDIPNLVNQTGDILEGTTTDKKLLTFRIRKA